LKLKAQEKQKDDTLELQKFLSGKTTLKTFFSKKPREEEIAIMERNIASVGKKFK